MWDIVKAVLILGAVIAAAFLAGGCARRPLPQIPDSAPLVSEAIARTDAHVKSAHHHVDQAVPHADDTGKVWLAAAQSDHVQAIAANDQAAGVLDAVKAERQQLRQQLDNEIERHQDLQARWYVRWGRRIERFVWSLAVAWLVAGIAAVVLGLGNPLGWAYSTSKEIVRAVPGMNPFAWIRDWLGRRRQEA